MGRSQIRSWSHSYYGGVRQRFNRLCISSAMIVLRELWRGEAGVILIYCLWSIFALTHTHFLFAWHIKTYCWNLFAFTCIYVRIVIYTHTCLPTLPSGGFVSIGLPASHWQDKNSSSRLWLICIGQTHSSMQFSSTRTSSCNLQTSVDPAILRPMPVNCKMLIDGERAERECDFYIRLIFLTSRLRMVVDWDRMDTKVV